MKLLKLNQQMLRNYPNQLLPPYPLLPSGLGAFLAEGLVEIDGCIFLKSLCRGAHGRPQDFPDRTGYECFVNHLHIDEFEKKKLVSIALSFLNELSKLSAEFSPQYSFTGIIGAWVSEADCTIRFHVNRPNEEWVIGDIESYEESICLVHFGKDETNTN